MSTAFVWPSNTNTSATGGDLLPNQPSLFPGTLTFEEFIQSVLSGVSGLAGNFVRSKWQIEPPNQPDVFVNWMAFGASEVDADFDAYQAVDSSGNNQFMRMEDITIQCSFYGPQAFTYTSLLRDGLQLRQNRELLQLADMDFVSTSKAVRAPDLVNERWVNRWEMSVRIRREILRVYPVLNFVSLAGTVIGNVSSGTKVVPITVED